MLYMNRLTAVALKFITAREGDVLQTHMTDTLFMYILSNDKSSLI